ncbi:MAG: mandelate racemase/muconate lactonizing protein [Chloroflexi bacterium]|nr:mandelate racemase/muconate lactonizing protein [Chloroflexota bacterium]MBT6681992.1 mandelate racemase/muconate lactonizing protein [Chloroflexota bacterium]
MKITEIKIRKLNGTTECDPEFIEDRVVMPIDVYPEHRPLQRAGLPRVDDTHVSVEGIFVQIESDEGVVGVGGPLLGEHLGQIIIDRLAPMILGRDPRSVELLWDQMFRQSPDGRLGDTLMAISAVDCALWDLKGKAVGEPVARLIGGPTRERIPAYASMLSFSTDDLGLVRERASEWKAKGYRAQKWFFRHGPGSGNEGVDKNMALAETLRSELGVGYDLMFDAWMSWDLPFSLKMVRRLEDVDPRWVEEPLMPDRLDGHTELRQHTMIPISGGEHTMTRWGFKSVVEARAMDILQPDIYWTGGLSEALKVAALASVHDLQIMVHGFNNPANLQFSTAMSPSLTPLQENLVQWSPIFQHFLKEPTQPVDGDYLAPSTPGMGMEIDPDKIESETVVSA